ncbi:TetR/AcrR family transcriptional regulator [Roseomonas sp. 18066]|uniref:TetR/AcrR family transcriptional regulator n=1 Tax=Roseomonas sp. 18066 TaxID=2681412 RepID=UPI00190F803B|nr:TetR-like C-terminal domain-containing protein [Roseomonas sp. 18066]
MSTSKEAYHHGELRPALLAAAEALLVAEGPAGLSLRAVARGAGVSHNAPYRHFASREALLAALAAEGFSRLAAALRAAPGLAGQGRAYLDFAAAHPALYRLMFGAELRAGSHPALKLAAGEAFSVLSGVAADRAGALAAWALVHGIAGLRADGHWPADVVLDSVLTRVT